MPCHLSTSLVPSNTSSTFIVHPCCIWTQRLHRHWTQPSQRLERSSQHPTTGFAATAPPSLNFDFTAYSRKPAAGQHRPRRQHRPRHHSSAARPPRRRLSTTGATLLISPMLSPCQHRHRPMQPGRPRSSCTPAVSGTNDCTDIWTRPSHRLKRSSQHPPIGFAAPLHRLRFSNTTRQPMLPATRVQLEISTIQSRRPQWIKDHRFKPPEVNQFPLHVHTRI